MNDDKSLITVAVLFGGRSAEHEVSIITGKEILDSLDSRKYRPIPVYIAQNGEWYTGDCLLDKSFYRQLPGSLASATRVVLMPLPVQRGLTVLSDRLGLRERLSGSSAAPLIPVDVFFPALHGTIGEDGCIQGLFEMAEVAYTGCGVESASIGMDKAQCKSILHAEEIPFLPWARVIREAWRKAPQAARDEALGKAGIKDSYPLFVKPCNLGSSIGISPANNVAELDSALAKAFQFDSEVMIEPQVKNLTELNVAVLEDDVPRVSVVERPLSESGVLTYEEKYISGGGKKGKSKGETGSLAAMERRLDPQDVDPAIKQRARELAKQVFETLGCWGVARIDFLLDGDNGKLYFNEINTLPGSMSYYLWENSEPPLTYTALLTHLITRALERRASLLGSQRDVGFKALFR